MARGLYDYPGYTADVIGKLRLWLKPELRERVLKDSRSSTGWVYEAIQQVCRSNNG